MCLICSVPCCLKLKSAHPQFIFLPDYYVGQTPGIHYVSIVENIRVFGLFTKKLGE